MIPNNLHSRFGPVTYSQLKILTDANANTQTRGNLNDALSIAHGTAGRSTAIRTRSVLSTYIAKNEFMLPALFRELREFLDGIKPNIEFCGWKKYESSIHDNRYFERLFLFILIQIVTEYIVNAVNTNGNAQLLSDYIEFIPQLIREFADATTEKNLYAIESVINGIQANNGVLNTSDILSAYGNAVNRCPIRMNTHIKCVDTCAHKTKGLQCKLKYVIIFIYLHMCL